MLSCDQAVFFRREGMVLGSLHLTDLSFFDKLVKLLLFGTVGCESNYTDKMRNY